MLEGVGHQGIYSSCICLKGFKLSSISPVHVLQYFSNQWTPLWFPFDPFHNILLNFFIAHLIMTSSTTTINLMLYESFSNLSFNILGLIENQKDTVSMIITSLIMAMIIAIITVKYNRIVCLKIQVSFSICTLAQCLITYILCMEAIDLKRREIPNYILLTVILVFIMKAQSKLSKMGKDPYKPLLLEKLKTEEIRECLDSLSSRSTRFKQYFKKLDNEEVKETHSLSAPEDIYNISKIYRDMKEDYYLKPKEELLLMEPVKNIPDNEELESKLRRCLEDSVGTVYQLADNNKKVVVKFCGADKKEITENINAYVKFMKKLEARKIPGAQTGMEIGYMDIDNTTLPILVMDSNLYKYESEHLQIRNPDIQSKSNTGDSYIIGSFKNLCSDEYLKHIFSNLLDSALSLVTKGLAPGYEYRTFFFDLVISKGDNSNSKQKLFLDRDEKLSLVYRPFVSAEGLDLYEKNRLNLMSGTEKLANIIFCQCLYTLSYALTEEEQNVINSQFNQEKSEALKIADADDAINLRKDNSGIEIQNTIGNKICRYKAEFVTKCKVQLENTKKNLNHSQKKQLKSLSGLPKS